jgi:hypothetical protein
MKKTPDATYLTRISNLIGQASLYLKIANSHELNQKEKPAAKEMQKALKLAVQACDALLGGE